MSQTQDTIVAALMEQLIAEGPDGMAQVFTTLFNLAMRLERERFLGAGLYERNPDRRGYANGYKSKTLDTTAGTVTVDVPKAAGMSGSRTSGTTATRALRSIGNFVYGP